MADKLSLEEFGWHSAIPPVFLGACLEGSGAWLVTRSESMLPTLGGAVLVLSGVALDVGTAIYAVMARNAQSKNRE